MFLGTQHKKCIKSTKMLLGALFDNTQELATGGTFLFTTLYSHVHRSTDIENKQTNM